MRKVTLAIGMGLLLAMICLTGIQAQTLCLTEAEPNGSWYHANSMDVPGCMLGTVSVWWNPVHPIEGIEGDNDVFVMRVIPGHKYTLNLDINSPQNLSVRVWVQDMDGVYILVTQASSILIDESFVATTGIVYLTVRYSHSFLPELPAAAGYRLDVTTIYRAFLPIVQRGN